MRMCTRVGPCVVLLLMAACGGESPVDPGIVAGLALTPTPLRVLQLESVQLLVTATDAEGHDLGRVTAMFEVGDEELATISGSGRLTSLGPARTSTLTARYGDAQVVVPFEVLPVLDSLGIALRPRLIVRPGETLPLFLLGFDRAGDPMTPAGVTLSTSRATVAEVTSPAPFDVPSLTAVAAGTALVTASAGEVTARLEVEVLAWPRTPLPAPGFGIAAASGVAFVTRLDGQLSRVDPASGMLGSSYPFYSAYVALNPTGTRAWFGNTVFDVASGTELHPALADASECGEIRAARERADAQVLYLGCVGSVWVAEAGTGNLIATIGFNHAHPVNSLTLHPTEPRLYASVPTAGRVYEINTETNQLIRELPILGGPQGSLIGADGSLVVAMEGDKAIKSWDLAGNTLRDSVPLALLPYEGSPFDLAVSVDGSRLLVSRGPFAVVVNATTLAVEQSYWVGGHARRIAVAGTRALVANEGGWIDLLPF